MTKARNRSLDRTDRQVTLVNDGGQKDLKDGIYFSAGIKRLLSAGHSMTQLTYVSFYYSTTSMKVQVCFHYLIFLITAALSVMSHPIPPVCSVCPPATDICRNRQDAPAVSSVTPSPLVSDLLNDWRPSLDVLLAENFRYSKIALFFLSRDVPSFRHELETRRFPPHQVIHLRQEVATKTAANNMSISVCDSNNTNISSETTVHLMSQIHTDLNYHHCQMRALLKLHLYTWKQDEQRMLVRSIQAALCKTHVFLLLQQRRQQTGELQHTTSRPVTPRLCDRRQTRSQADMDLLVWQWLLQVELSSYRYNRQLECIMEG